MANHRFTLEAGRTIYRDGKPYISIHAHGHTATEHEPHDPNDHWYDPTTVDEIVREIARKVFNCDYGLPSDDRSPIRMGSARCSECLAPFGSCEHTRGDQ